MPTADVFLLKVNPDLQMKLMSYTLAETANSPSAPVLALIAQAYSRDIAIAWISTQLLKFLMYCTPQNKELNSEQMYECAVAIFTQYYYLNVYEIAQFFGLCRTARYGKFYGQPTPLDIMDMLQQHVRARNIELDRKDREEAAERIANQEVFINGYQKYMDKLTQRANEGDAEAAAILKRHEKGI